ncbi:patatin-like phospholipase family protein [Protaetiibacter sp. 10F1B-8-1]|uniref:Patatin-like phospholipase family protein n=1 Tax=Protaetiibacter mangrovi TaxID=2970926 RepID=A0ABT1ZC87_9MICO|nr:patatin-like phospholipase family protein [Protaetiibacter mangrovi]MCS0498323.1 patatin-like phospholipase family protein [Protaetiibacter mangrovi]
MPSGRALVLGGGGSAGNAWLIGIVAGLDAAGLEVTDAELMVGTSAGSTAAAQLAGRDPRALLADILATPVPAVDRRPAPGRPGASQLERTNAVIAASTDVVDMRRRMGSAFLEHVDPTAGERWRATVAARLPVTEWPARRLLITAVDAQTGDPVVFDRQSGVSLVDAVAASCAGGAAHSIGERSYIDGGYRTNADNADLASGCARVLVLSPLGGRTRLPAEWGLRLADQVAALRAEGSLVETVFPDEDSLSAFGGNMMDLAARAPAARAGAAQGEAIAARLAEFWGSPSRTVK